jgi:hypothetical protein
MLKRTTTAPAYFKKKLRSRAKQSPQQLTFSHEPDKIMQVEGGRRRRSGGSVGGGGENDED